MEKPQITILSLHISERPNFVTRHPVYTAEITYSQSDVDYSLKVSGEGSTHPEALQDAVRAMNWDIALDSTFSSDEVNLLKVAHQLYVEQGESSTWYMENVLAQLSKVNMQMHVESNAVRILAKEKLLLRYDDVARTLFRLSDFGKYIVESHPQFKTTG